VIEQSEVRAAAERIAGRVRRTPVLDAGGSLTFKLEHLQFAGSFKTRGMVNRMLAAGRLPAAGIVAASGGNAGLAAAYAARELGVPAEVYVPETAPPVKVAKLAKLGARVVQVGAEYAEAYAAAVVHAERAGAMFCHAYDDPDMVAGNGTLGLELHDQLAGRFDTVLVAVGGGGLIAGVAAALPDTARIVAVEPATRSARGGSARSRTGPRWRPAWRRCSSTTRRSWTPGAGCGRTTGSRWSTAPRPRTPH
jgi:threonine dehydratase